VYTVIASAVQSRAIFANFARGPTWLVKDVRRLLSPLSSLLLNKSPASGCHASEFKKAVVRPLLKKNTGKTPHTHTHTHTHTPV